MIAPNDAQSSLYMGSSSIPIVFAEVVPIVLVAVGTEEDCDDQFVEASKDHQQLFPLTNFGVKQFLLRESREADAMAISTFTSGSAHGHQFFIRWKATDDDSDLTSISSGYVFQNEKNGLCATIDSSRDQEKVPLVYIPSDNPTIIDRQPCCIIAYAYKKDVSNHPANSSTCHFFQDTLIRILPPRLATNSMALNRRCLKSVSQLTASTSSSLHFRRESMLCDLIGEEGGRDIADDMIEELLQNHNDETIRELKLKISGAMTSVRIGTTFDAFHIQEKQEKQMRKIEQCIRLFSGSTFEKDIPFTAENNNRAVIQSWPSLIVHSPNHADGKTLLVQALAKRLGCSSVHLIRPGALIAKYSIRADSALESQLHAILISAACRNEKVCIILDQLDMMLPSRLSGRTSSGDSSVPIFNAISSYLKKITDSMQRKGEFPFPMKNPLYNPTGCGSSSGQVFSVEFCLIGILTCPDDGWRSHRKDTGGSVDGGSSILDCMAGDRYRIPLRTTKTILSAFNAAFAREDVTLAASARERLALIVSYAPWAKGSVFRQVAKHLKSILVDASSRDSDNGSGRSEATVQDLEMALELVNPNTTGSVKIKNSDEAETSLEEKNKTSPSYFGSIGGVENAKASLEDALAFDRKKREILSRFGLFPPTAVLLYGPPGCGKTLLAKAVARLFKSSVSDTAQSLSQGGTFISLSISEIVSAEVGTSEKTIASSFEYAEKNAPSVIFLDEFQALFTDRNRGGSGKLTTVLLQCLDDIKRWHEIDSSMKSDQTITPGGGKRVVVIAATNTPWMIDSAFLRPGRFDRVVHVGLPCLSERKSILQVHIGRMRLCGGDKVDTISGLCEELSILTKGFSGADIAALCRAAAVRALGQGEGTSVEGCHFKDALKLDVFPSSDDALVKRLSAWRP